MDPHSEVEAKFEATGLLPSQIQEFMDERFSEHSFRRVAGIDQFWNVGGKVVRARFDRQRLDERFSMGSFGVETCCLTIKARKSEASLLDRHEVDLPVGAISAFTVSEFLEMLGAKYESALSKEYWVWIFTYPLGETSVTVCLALYDVNRFGDFDNKRRYLEIEIEKHSECSDEVGKTELQFWIGLLKRTFTLEDPANVSLYELYKAP
jgi:hypothetical protein